MAADRSAEVGGIRPRIPYNPNISGPLFDPKEPIIERLAEAARPKKEQPTAGWYGIQRAKEPDVEVPPECMLYEQDYPKFSLGSAPAYRDYPHAPVPPALAWVPGDESAYVFTPLWKVSPTSPELVAVDILAKEFARIIPDAVPAPMSQDVEEMRRLVEEQKRMALANANPLPNEDSGVSLQKSKSKEKSRNPLIKIKEKVSPRPTKK